MEEIKFRAWNGKEMILNDSLYEFQKQNLTKEEFSQYTFLQFTGLKDKNRKEIYTGDIVKFTLYDGERDRLEVAKLEFSLFHPLMAKHLECEIIGNVFENPELIK